MEITKYWRDKAPAGTGSPALTGSTRDMKKFPDVTVRLKKHSANVPTLSREAQTLLKEAAHDPKGTVYRVLGLEGLAIQTNGKKFVEKDNPRSGAIWEGAVQELEKAHLIADKGSARELFTVTREGYEVAELLNP
jgi:hypothetical protein